MTITEEELRRRATRLRRISDEAWAYLKKKGYVDEALDKGLDHEAVDYIVNEFAELPGGSPGSGRGGRPSTDGQGKKIVVQDFEPELSAYEIERSAAYAEYLA